jgi:hypothetical protein
MPGPSLATGYPFSLADWAGQRSNLAMGSKTTFVCDCCFRESDNNLGWARVKINGASDGKQLMPDDERDLCEICWSPLQMLMKEVEEKARERRKSPG